MAVDISEINKYVGERIRTIRKGKKMSIQQLADAINKSKACVSKYEKGEITVDIPTLFEIAEVLEILPERLIDYQIKPKVEIGSALGGTSSFFKASKLYFYYCDGRFTNIKEGVINIQNENGGAVCPANFIINIKTESGYTTEIFYTGTVTYSDMLIRFSFQNQYNALEEDLLYIFNPLEYRDGTSGLLCGISSTDLVPVAYKCIVSINPMQETDTLKERLKFTKKELSQIRKMNMLTVTNDFN